MAGTGGAILGDGRVCFTPSSDTLSPLFSVRTPGRLTVSNSPIFAMVMADEQPAPHHPFYGWDLVRIFRAGLGASDPRLKTLAGAGLGVHFFHSLSVDRDGHVTSVRRPAGDAPASFDHYRTLVAGGVERVFYNAADSCRQVRRHPLALVSAGYDCSATAALAAQAGCREAATLVDSRRPTERQDSGAAVAQALGMQCQEFDRWAYRALPEPVEPEFAFSGISSSPSFAVMEGLLAGRLLIEGVLGDHVWNPDKVGQMNDMVRPWLTVPSGLSKLEFRLRTGFASFGPIAIGMQHHRQMQAIANASELQSWSIGGSYDRPVARRILEEAGVPRDAFGVRKLASGHVHLCREGGLSPSAQASYEAFLREHLDSGPKMMLARARVATESAVWKRFRQAAPTPEQCLAPAPFGVAIEGARIAHDWPYMFMFQWAFASLRDRYAGR